MWKAVKYKNENKSIVTFFVLFLCTIKTSETELILRTYIVTPTSTGGPATLLIN